MIDRYVDFQYVKQFTDFYGELYDLKSKIRSDIKAALIKCAESENYEDIAQINKFKIDNVFEVERLDVVYESFKFQDGPRTFLFKRGYPEKYYIPFSYDIFRIAHYVPVVMLDATFYEILFRHHLESYNFEYGLKKDLNVVIYRSKAANPNSTVFRMRPKSAHPKTNFFKRKYKTGTLKWVKKDLKMIGSIFGSENVGVITYKALTIDNIVSNREEFLGFEAMHYGNLLGSNSFSDKKVLVILGTYDIPRSQVVEELNKHYLGYYQVNDLIDVEDIKGQIKELQDEYGSSWTDNLTDLLICLNPLGISGEDFEDGYKAIWDSTSANYGYLPYLLATAFGENEVYQALHRSRLLSNDVIVFAYCHLPRQFDGGAEIRKIYVKDTDKLFDELKEKYCRPRSDMAKVSKIVQDIDEGMSPTDICKKYNIREKGKYKAKEMKAMKEVIKFCKTQ